jgi:hypothetical protein
MVPYEGPNGVALVKAWPDGRTDPGWGLNPPKGSLEGFMPRYLRGEFDARRVLFGYERDRWAFAIVMRSLRLVCIDIDGKNGGIDTAKGLILPPTLAETSKSGDGYHLFYFVDEVWHNDEGYASLHDRIAFVQGVDFRSTGCVYHHKQQLWNDRKPVILPQHIHELLSKRQQGVAATQARITSVLAGDDQMEVLMLQDEILSRLKKPIPQGKRNNTLFAIGAEMKSAAIPGWEQLLTDRALDLGLGADETVKLVKNVGLYATTP